MAPTGFSAGLSKCAAVVVRQALNEGVEVFKRKHSSLLKTAGLDSPKAGIFS
jgi:hypothetical protein